MPCTTGSSTSCITSSRRTELPTRVILTVLFLISTFSASTLVLGSKNPQSDHSDFEDDQQFTRLPLLSIPRRPIAHDLNNKISSIESQQEPYDNGKMTLVSSAKFSVDPSNSQDESSILLEGKPIPLFSIAYDKSKETSPPFAWKKREKYPQKIIQRREDDDDFFDRVKNTDYDTKFEWKTEPIIDSLKVVVPAGRHSKYQENPLASSPSLLPNSNPNSQYISGFNRGVNYFLQDLKNKNSNGQNTYSSTHSAFVSLPLKIVPQQQQSTTTTLGSQDSKPNSQAGTLGTDGGKDKNVNLMSRPSISSGISTTASTASAIQSSTNEPTWVKLEPVYDPFSFFSMNKNKQQQDVVKSTLGPRPSSFPVQQSTEDSDDSSKFSNRLGSLDELTPESFASRYGWGPDGPLNGPPRIPSWLQERPPQAQGHHKYFISESGTRNKQDPYTRRPYDGINRNDDGKKWVKLEPIPVAGVTIAKWVPKGTPNSELPSTNYNVRDRPNSWWDKNKNHPGQSAPLSSSSWGNKGAWNYDQEQYATQQKRPISSESASTASWSDIIYPDTPISATASWEASKKGIQIVATRPSFWSDNQGDRDRDRPSPSDYDRDQNRDRDRRPPLKASWSAPGVSPGRYGANRRPPYPSNGNNKDRNDAGLTDPNDPRWILVSDSRRGNKNRDDLSINRRFHYEPYGNRYSDDLPAYDPYFDDYIGGPGGFRMGKKANFNWRSQIDHRDNSQQDSTTEYDKKKQDEIYQKVNETLESLTPVLNYNDRFTNETTKTDADILREKVNAEKANGHNHKRNTLLNGFKKTMEKFQNVLPMMLGRRRKRSTTEFNQYYNQLPIHKPFLISVDANNEETDRSSETNKHTKSRIILG